MLLSVATQNWSFIIATPSTKSPKLTTAASRTETSRAFAIAAAKSLRDSRCTNVVVLDVRGLSPICDLFVIATGTSARQMRSVAEDVVELGKANDFGSVGGSELDSDSWILVDCVDVVVHVFSAEARAYYDLDSLWGDARQIDIGAGPKPE